MAQNVGDTQEKIIMKDHDILIALNTRVSDLISAVQGMTSQLQSNQIASFQEFKQVAVIQTQQKGEIDNLKGDIVEANERMKTMDARWKIGDIIIALGAIAGILIGLFK